MTDWWAVRRAHSQKPSTYTCPLCGRQLHAIGDIADRVYPGHTRLIIRIDHDSVAGAQRHAGIFQTESARIGSAPCREHDRVAFEYGPIRQRDVERGSPGNGRDVTPEKDSDAF